MKSNQSNFLQKLFKNLSFAKLKEIVLFWNRIQNSLSNIVLIYVKLKFPLPFTIQAALVICGLFICNFEYMRSRNGLFSGTYPLIYSHPWSFYIRICYMQAYFLESLSLAYNEVHLYFKQTKESIE
jgi:hypothetical protein